MRKSLFGEGKAKGVRGEVWEELGVSNHSINEIEYTISGW